MIVLHSDSDNILLCFRLQSIIQLSFFIRIAAFCVFSEFIFLGGTDIKILAFSQDMQRFRFRYGKSGDQLFP